MKIYKIRDIAEADYGCEECPKDGPHALLICEGIVSDSTHSDAEKDEDEKRIEVSEKWITENGIEKGKLISVKEDGTVMKAIRVVAAVIRAQAEEGYDSNSISDSARESVNGSGDSNLKNHAEGRDRVTRIFATQRGYGDLKGGWEFPGGKIEEGETPQEALKREIKEELDTEISVGELLDVIEYDYPTFHLSMDCFWCEVISGDLVLKEHEAAKWLSKEQLNSVEWLPADVTLIEKIRRII